MQDDLSSSIAKKWDCLSSNCSYKIIAFHWLWLTYRSILNQPLWLEKCDVLTGHAWEHRLTLSVQGEINSTTNIWADSGKEQSLRTLIGWQAAKTEVHYSGQTYFSYFKFLGSTLLYHSCLLLTYTPPFSQESQYTVTLLCILYSSCYCILKTEISVLPVFSDHIKAVWDLV